MPYEFLRILIFYLDPVLYNFCFDYILVGLGGIGIGSYLSPLSLLYLFAESIGGNNIFLPPASFGFSGVITCDEVILFPADNIIYLLLWMLGYLLLESKSLDPLTSIVQSIWLLLSIIIFLSDFVDKGLGVRIGFGIFRVEPLITLLFTIFSYFFYYFSSLEF